MLKLNHQKNSVKGFIFLWALFAVALAGIMLASTGQVWKVKAQREKEKELLLVGEQFRRAFASYYNRSSSGARKYPESLEELLTDKRMLKSERHLRKIFLDPMTKSNEWGIVAELAPEENSEPSIKSKRGIIGIYSLSKNIPVKTGEFPEHYADFRTAETYQDWKFVYKQEDHSGGGGASLQAQSQQNATTSRLHFPRNPELFR